MLQYDTITKTNIATHWTAGTNPDHVNMIFNYNIPQLQYDITTRTTTLYCSYIQL